MFLSLLIGFVGGCAGGVASKVAEDGYSSVKGAIINQPNVKLLQEQFLRNTGNLSNRIAGFALKREMAPAEKV